MKYSKEKSKKIKINGKNIILHDYVLSRASIFSFLLDDSVSQEPVDIKIPLTTESDLEKILDIMHLASDYGNFIIKDLKIEEKNQFFSRLEYMVRIVTSMMYMSLEKCIIDDCVNKMLITQDDDAVLLELINMKICPNVLLIINDNIAFSSTLNIENIKLINNNLKINGYTESFIYGIVMKMFKINSFFRFYYDETINDAINLYRKKSETINEKNITNLCDEDIDEIYSNIIKKLKEKYDNQLIYRKFIAIMQKKIAEKLFENTSEDTSEDMSEDISEEMKEFRKNPWIVVGSIWIQYKKDFDIVV